MPLWHGEVKSVSTLQVFDCEQNTPEWQAARLGIPTASCFDDVLAQGRGGAPSKTRRTYMLKLVGERITGDPMDNYTNAHMERGHAMEDEARRLYVFTREVEVTRVGFVRNEIKAMMVGCSPDALIGDDGVLEIKTKLAHLQAEALLDGVLPPEHKAQVQGQLWVTGRTWVDFVSYCPKMRPLIVRVLRDEPYIRNLEDSVAVFYRELLELERRVRTGAAL